MGVVQAHIDEHVGKLVLNRPEAANAFSLAMLSEIIDQLSLWKDDPNIRTLLISAEGDKVFSAGADLKERAEMNQDQVREAVQLIRTMIQKVYEFPKPVIAAINGAAIGGGLELALACDLRIASENASFALTETSLGIIPGAGGTQLLPRIVGVHKAKEMIFTGRRLSAHEALKEGIILRVTDRKELLMEGLKLASQISSRGPVANTQAKIAINAGMDRKLADGLDIEKEAYEKTIPTKDRIEGLMAFKEKRAPKFTGN